LGAGWAIFQPLLAAIIFTVFFNHVAKINSGSSKIPYPVFAYLGLMYWNAFSGAVSTISNSLLSNSGVLTKIYFPRLIPPLAATGLSIVDFFFAAIVFFVIMLGYRVLPGVIGLLMIVPVLLVLMLAALGMGIFFAALNVKYRDVRSAMPFIIQIGFFVTPVIYPISYIPTRFQSYAYLNPAAGPISTVKAALFKEPIPWHGFLISTIVSSIVLVLGIWYFKRVEKNFADII
jgi:lipopolysaccharide transport system permease protein